MAVPRDYAVLVRLRISTASVTASRMLARPATNPATIDAMPGRSPKYHAWGMRLLHADDDSSCLRGEDRNMTTTTTPAHRREDAISLRAVAKSYAGRPAVHPTTLTLRRGETVALLGPNGAGKSTTIGMMLGLIAPDAGEVRVVGASPREAVRGGRIAAMLQDSGMMPGVRVAELVRLGERLYPDSISTDKALGLAGLTDQRSRRVDRLSGGQAQRLRFALAMVANPDVLVLDEPTRALDVQGRNEFWVAMQAGAARGTTVLFATHYLQEVDENADRVVIMAHGRVIADGTPEDIRTRTGISTVRVTLDRGTERLTHVDGVRSIDIHGGRVTVRTTNPDAAVRAITAEPDTWHGIEVTPPSLDESFLSLTETTATEERK